MYKSVFMFWFLVREMKSWPLILILWYAGRRREDRPLTHPSPHPPLWHIALTKAKRTNKQKKSSVFRLTHFQCCTSCGRSQMVLQLCLLSSFLASFLRAGDVTPSSLLRCHGPAMPTVISVPRGYCRDVTFSTFYFVPALPQWAASLVYSVGEQEG